MLGTLDLPQIIDAGGDLGGLLSGLTLRLQLLVLSQELLQLLLRLGMLRIGRCGLGAGQLFGELCRDPQAALAVHGQRADTLGFRAVVVVGPVTVTVLWTPVHCPLFDHALE